MGEVAAASGVSGGVYGRIVASRVRSQLAYPASFALDVVAQLLTQGVELVAILVVFTQVSALGGFSVGEVLLMYGIAATAFGLADLTVGEIEELPELIRAGEFDVLLLRPLSTLAQVLTVDIALRRIGRVVTGAGVYAYALVTLDLTWSAPQVLVGLTAPVVGAVLIGAIFVGTNAVSFWLVDGREVANSFTYGSNFATSYPLTIFGPGLRRVLCFVVPAAFVAYFPALALLGRPDPLGLPDALRWCAPAVALLVVAVAATVWRFGVRHYQGTGS
ncbi:MAG: ABC transporter permease [Pseudonocardia sp.]